MAPGRRGPIPGCKGGVNAAFQMVGHSPNPASESRIARLPCTRYRHSHCPGAPACLADQPRHARGRVAARLGQAAPSPRVRLRPFLQQSGFWCQRRRAICAPMLHLLRRSLTALTRTIHVKSHRTAPETRYAWVGFPAGEVIQDCLVRDAVQSEPVSRLNSLFLRRNREFLHILHRCIRHITNRTSSISATFSPTPRLRNREFPITEQGIRASPSGKPALPITEIRQMRSAREPVIARLCGICELCVGFKEPTMGLVASGIGFRR